MENSSLFNTPEVSAAKTTAQNSSATASRAAQSAATLPDMLRDTLTKKFEGNPLYGQRETAVQNYLNTSTQAPIDYTHTSAGGNSDVIYNPMQQANLIQGRRANALSPITTLNSLLGLQVGGMDDIIDATSRGAQAQVAGMQTQAELDRQSYTDLIDLIGKQADEDYRQAQLQLDRDKANSGGSGDLSSLLAMLMGGQTQEAVVDDNFWEEIPDMKVTAAPSVDPTLMTPGIYNPQSNALLDWIGGLFGGGNQSATEALGIKNNKLPTGPIKPSNISLKQYGI